MRTRASRENTRRMGDARRGVLNVALPFPEPLPARKAERTEGDGHPRSSVKGPTPQPGPVLSAQP